MKRKSKVNTQIIDQASLVASQLERFEHWLSLEEFGLLNSVLDQPLLPGIRLNPLKAPADFPQLLRKRYGWQFTPVEFCPTGYRVEPGNGPALSDTIEYRNGLYYIQEVSSMLPVELFTMDRVEEKLTLDLAASPGGKTTHLASRMMDQGLILANDSSQGRIQALRIVLQHWGTENTAVTRFPGESFGAWFPGVFDRVLLDAPCSMQGLRTTESHPARPITTKESRQLAKRQVTLLESALMAVRVGGEVVYSTCTLAPEENEEVVEKTLKIFGGAVTLQNAQKYLPRPAPGINLEGNASRVEDMGKTIRLWPHRYNTAGFFACLFIKNAPVDLNPRTPPSHSMQKAGFFEMSLRDQKSLAEEFEQNFGFALWEYLTLKRRTLVTRDDKVFVFPRILLERFADLPVQSAGLQLCNKTPEGIMPSFDWSTRFALQCTRVALNLDLNDSLEWQKGKGLDNPASSNNSVSPVRMVMNQHGQFIGRGKLVQGVLKNLDYHRYK